MPSAAATSEPEGLTDSELVDIGTRPPRLRAGPVVTSNRNTATITDMQNDGPLQLVVRLRVEYLVVLSLAEGVKRSETSFQRRAVSNPRHDSSATRYPPSVVSERLQHASVSWTKDSYQWRVSVLGHASEHRETILATHSHAGCRTRCPSPPRQMMRLMRPPCHMVCLR